MEVSEQEQERDVEIDVRGEEAEVADQEEKEPIRSEKERESTHIPHDSMVTVRLSEPSIITPIPPPTSKTTLHVDTNLQERQDNNSEKTETDTPGILLEEAEEEIEDSPRITLVRPNDSSEVLSPSGSESPASGRLDAFSERRESVSSDGSMEGGPGVNWEELERSEEQEPRNENSDDSTALLLARLEQENNLLATNPKSGMAKKVEEKQRAGRQSRPPSIMQLKRMVTRPTPPALRYSQIPAPPMTDLEFYAALVQDYARTAQCLPTLLSKKIRSGIPPPLRGVVWQSMSGARDPILEDHFDRLCGESSPYEGIIGKDLGRSFPGVEMFRDPEGDGQRMLGRVLKCFSLYDHKIGYCQGLGFLVGPLLMHMGDKQAFCVLVRLMEHYDLRACFLPDLSGLHVRIYQFRQLLKLHLPKLAAHLDHLQIDPAYVSQWFLSFFAVTCPLPMLFRIYDVIFAEGASETIMRVALSLMRKNEEKIMACSEMEDAMQLLLSRVLWDVYHQNADEFVSDFVSMTGQVTRESLNALEASYKEAKTADAVSPSENVGSVAGRFLGRLWIGSNSSTKSMLSPGMTAPTRPVSFLRRTPSRQSIASTLNSMEGGGSDSMLSATTEATTISRDSSNTDNSSIRGQSVNFNAARAKEDKNLHSQIEDLLTALSEMQRDHAILATQLQKEREERDEDRSAVRSLLDTLRKKVGASDETSHNDDSDDTLKVLPIDNEDSPQAEDETPSNEVTADQLSHLLDVVEDRFSKPTDRRRSSMLQTKSQLRDDLVRAKEQLIIETSRSQDFSRQISEHQQEISNLNDQVKESHTHIRNAHQEKQRLEKQIHDLRVKSKTVTTTPDGTQNNETEWPSSRTSGSSHGLREFRLGRTNSHKSVSAPVFNKRTSSLNMGAIMGKEIGKENITPPSASRDPSPEKKSEQDVDTDALVLELVQAKTAEAIAKQEAEEAKSKLESLKKLMSGGGAGGGSLGNGMGGGYFGGGHKSTPSVVSDASVTPPATAPATTTGGGFWTGWGKRTVSSGAE